MKKRDEHIRRLAIFADQLSREHRGQPFGRATVEQVHRLREVLAQLEVVRFI